MYQRSTSQTPSKTISDQAKEAARKKGKPFCKVCFDAKKSESEYTSHYLKSAPGPHGKVVCPTLLNQSCLTCGQPGHTSSYCDKRTQPQPQSQPQCKPQSQPQCKPQCKPQSQPQPQPQSQPQSQCKPKCPAMNATTMSKVVIPLLKPEFSGMPPKSQFWWQDE